METDPALPDPPSHPAQAADLLNQIGSTQREIRAAAASPTWFIISVTGVLGALCAAYAIPPGNVRTAFLCAIAIGAIGLLFARREALRSLHNRWSALSIVLTAVTAVVGGAAVWVCQTAALSGKPLCVAIGAGLFVVLAALALWERRTEANRSTADR
ncbi:MAG: hypothetical protein LBH48_00925 [Bifidobacteriaceae bacterium]|jgi:hypothetical protein|nr:hypothetical protein [Bifidobacteriaceae bacterium]